MAQRSTRSGPGIKSNIKNDQTDDEDALSRMDSTEMGSEGGSVIVCALRHVLILDWNPKSHSLLRKSCWPRQDEEVQMVGGNELHQRIKSLKERRRSDQINGILYAAARGDLPALKKGFKVFYCLILVFFVEYEFLLHGTE